jgi:hopanoid C-3 methylase
VPWSHYDMHHLLWEPRLGAKRFFELYRETWRRSILTLGGNKPWRDWAHQVKARDLALLTRMLLRTQRMMRPEPYLREHLLAEPDGRAVSLRTRGEPLTD